MLILLIQLTLQLSELQRVYSALLEISISPQTYSAISTTTDASLIVHGQTDVRHGIRLISMLAIS